MDKAEIIKTIAGELLGKMINKFEVEVEDKDGMFHVIIKADEEAPTIIGRHGETIRSLQKIMEVMLYKQLNEPVSLLVNVNDYRERQKERLEAIAADAAERVKASRQPSYLRHFSAYERKMMHEYVTQNNQELTSYSIGEGRDRRLVIDLKENAPVDEKSQTETTA